MLLDGACTCLEPRGSYVEKVKEQKRGRRTRLGRSSAFRTDGKIYPNSISPSKAVSPPFTSPCDEMETSGRAVERWEIKRFRGHFESLA